jgi:hypothetical protein
MEEEIQTVGRIPGPVRPQAHLPLILPKEILKAKIRRIIKKDDMYPPDPPKQPFKRPPAEYGNPQWHELY